MFKRIRTESVPAPTIRRLPTYLNCLLHIQAKGVTAVSSSTIAEMLSLTGIQVRKDLAWVSDSGKPRTGFPIDRLINDIKNFLGYNELREAALIGVGHLGGAFLHYPGFNEYGLTISMAFDVNTELIKQYQNDTVPVYSMSDLSKVQLPELAILTVPKDQAQAVAEQLVQYGTRAIWNFSTVHLNLPETVIVENVDLAQSLALLWNQYELQNMNIKR
ncbi:redox-sensing transcriptional repressor Rex [Amygdalobacter nucleatus]|uniref:Redox-sensing transcriptional repressor Rex n=1 Tax=Amygdalobacter nucleatus TaxID=3029274 RepID=A0A133YAK3_9FIRM|nr:redox-sensing transcriptional repressor Rex [Amygdalobacter nucleatus]KXB40202.1 putative redox-sensing transcriptional repressor Rex [Amygdalobacter nucleatus]MDF0485773.1 redox-sensing transcriptional repressor Rex [Amygdalobacter nucleatus]WEG36394.1 redox-sensing transcriptional repressor Rex [Amygdalobacter nucleatus]